MRETAEESRDEVRWGVFFKRKRKKERRVRWSEVR